MTVSLWEATALECVYKTLFLRVYATRSSYRWAWTVSRHEKVRKAPSWWGEGVKGYSQAEAAGYSGSRETAQKDALAMAESILKQEARKK
jgi:hypothetical protein